MTAAPLPAAAPHPVNLSQRWPRADWARCRISTGGAADPDAALWGTIIGHIAFGACITAYEVELDDGRTMLAWPSRVTQLPRPLGGRAPQLRVLTGDLA